MRQRPPDLSDPDLRAAITPHWGLKDLDDVELEYVPMGAGSYHWRASRFFVTVDDLSDKPFLGHDPETVYERLGIALETAAGLRRHGLEFVVAPLEASDRSVLCRLGNRYAVALYPFLGKAQPLGRTLTADQRSAVSGMLARLHAARPLIGVRTSKVSPEVPRRADLELALISESGPSSLLRNGAMIRSWLARFDQLVSKYEASNIERVFTHGEPHSRNVIPTGDGYVLVDWDTVGLAPRERDLWLVGGGDAELCELYRLRWRLDDLSSAVRILMSHSVSDDLRERASMVLRSSIEHEPFTRD